MLSLQMYPEIKIQLFMFFFFVCFIFSFDFYVIPLPVDSTDFVFMSCCSFAIHGIRKRQKKRHFCTMQYFVAYIRYFTVYYWAIESVLMFCCRFYTL